MIPTEPTYKSQIVSRLSQSWAGFGNARGPGPGGNGEVVLRPAAVLVPIVARPEPTVLFTRRTEHLPAHAGQISFPGGRVAKDDESIAATALRETEEENRHRTKLRGCRGLPRSLHNRHRLCDSAGGRLCARRIFARTNPAEVAEIFELPLDYI